MTQINESTMADDAAGDMWVDSWFTIWYRPRATIRRIVETNQRKFVLLIAWLVGAFAALNMQVMAARIDLPANVYHLSRFGPIAIFAFISGVLSIVTLYGLAALYRWAGAILGGSATAIEVRAALAWAQVPGLYLVVVTIVATALGLYTPDVPPAASPAWWFRAIVGIWVFVILLKCLGEVHHFSAWRALGAILLGTLAMFVVALGLLIAIWLAVLVGRSVV
jgi:hypothetical protein